MSTLLIFMTHTLTCNIYHVKKKMRKKLNNKIIPKKKINIQSFVCHDNFFLYCDNI